MFLRRTSSVALSKLIISLVRGDGGMPAHCAAQVNLKYVKKYLQYFYFFQLKSPSVIYLSL